MIAGMLWSNGLAKVAVAVLCFGAAPGWFVGMGVHLRRGAAAAAQGAAAQGAGAQGAGS